MCNDYIQAGLKIIDPLTSLTYANSQKMFWVKNLLDLNYTAPLRYIDFFLEKINDDASLLWNSFAPESILKSQRNNEILQKIIFKAYFL